MLALTATAAPPVRDEIVERLGLRDPGVLIRGFDRPTCASRSSASTASRAPSASCARCEARIAERPPPGIVYVSTRREAEELAEALCRGELRAASYHAGMKAAERDDVQERFMDGELDVVVATTAFGMGIDKADVRWVFHAEVAESLDAYYQEVGRAGRDGEPAEIVLFYRSEDVGLRRFFAGGHVEVDEIAQVLDAVRERDGPVEPTSCSTRPSSRRPSSPPRCRGWRTRARVQRAARRRGRAAPTTRRRPTPCAPRPRPRRCAARFDRSRVDMMRAYAETDDCRRAFLLSYFGEPFEPPCGHCDNCEAGRVAARRRPTCRSRSARGSRTASGARASSSATTTTRWSCCSTRSGYKTLALDVSRARCSRASAAAASPAT